ncbi:MAG: hypothetical protein M3417_07680 [Actinomycetota bacterium]|nr:hypothetical protein [Actinomycetota bacterium]
MNRRLISTLTATAAGLTLAAGATPASAQTGEERVVDLDRATPVREYDGRLLFSRWDGSAYRLATLHEGQLRDLPVPPQSEPFDADAGPDSAGNASAVVSLCDATCDLFVLGFEEGDELRPVRNANTTGNDETDPSIWNGRLVFAREYGTRVIPYTKRLRAPRSRPSDRLAGLPRERCGASEPPDCRPIEGPDLVQMELYGERVAQSWQYQPEGFGGFRQNEVRLTNIDRTDTRQIAYMSTGIGGQTYLGPSMAKGRVAFYRACQGDPGGCSTQNSGAIRYRISDDSYELAGANEAWQAWEWNGANTFHVLSDLECSDGGAGEVPNSEQCGIYRGPDPDWQAVDADQVN